MALQEVIDELTILTEIEKHAKYYNTYEEPYYSYIDILYILKSTKVKMNRIIRLIQIDDFKIFKCINTALLTKKNLFLTHKGLVSILIQLYGRTRQITAITRMGKIKEIDILNKKSKDYIALIETAPDVNMKHFRFKLNTLHSV
jgi:hypothetical protein